jgi:tetratricopeptide (TPR) repeat protein
MFDSNRFGALALWVLAVPALLLADAKSFEKAKLLYERTDYSAAIQLLQNQAEMSPAEMNLLGRCYFASADYKKATEAFEKATKNDPQNADHWHWLGRTFGRRAELSTFISAPGYASKARQNFEKAVQLNPKHSEALNDLFEYYIQAPGFLGGGFDKAQGLLDKIGAIDAAEKHYAMARLAEERKDFKSAEAQFRRAMESAPRQIGRIVDLAHFLSTQGRTAESDAIFEQAQKVNPNHPTYLFGRAHTLVEQKRNLSEAKQLLQKYLKSPVSPEDDHRDEARKLLAKIQSE